MKSRMLEEMVHVYRKSAGSRAHRKCVLFNLEEVEAKIEEVAGEGGGIWIRNTGNRVIIIRGRARNPNKS
jgi:hypothetical protein